MNINPLAQAKVFLACLGVGMGLGVSYDLLRLVRRAVSRRVLRELLDLAFCLGACLTLFLSSMVLGDGRVRLYIAVSLFLGAAWYFLLLSPWVRRGLDALLRLVRRLFRLVTAPFRKLFFILTAPLIKEFRFVKKTVKKRFSFSALWSKIYHLIHNSPGKEACPRGEET